jgi:hypothetical protein
MQEQQPRKRETVTVGFKYPPDRAQELQNFAWSHRTTVSALLRAAADEMLGYYDEPADKTD